MVFFGNRVYLNLIDCSFVSHKRRKMSLNLIKELISEWKESKNEIHDVLDEFNCLTLKILCKTAMGVHVGKENPDMSSQMMKIEKSVPLK